MPNPPWPSKFVGSHILLTEPAADHWDIIPNEWNQIRWDAADVLFVSPFFVGIPDSSITIGEGNALWQRFHWVIRAARSKNPNIKIILEQFYHNTPDSDFRFFHGDENKIRAYANSVASLIEAYYTKTLPAISGDGQISARIDGWDVDVESSTDEPDLPKVLTAVRGSLNGLKDKLGSAPFSVSITPAWTHQMNASFAQSCDYFFMQNYSGGVNTSPQDYLNAVPGLDWSQLIWGFCSEEPWRNTLTQFADVKTKVLEVTDGNMSGAYTWRLNSDSQFYENIFQVWLYNTVHGVTLPNSVDESLVAKFWGLRGGRDGNRVLSPEELK